VLKHLISLLIDESNKDTA
jgi:hypothetical protein